MSSTGLFGLLVDFYVWQHVCAALLFFRQVMLPCCCLRTMLVVLQVSAYKILVVNIWRCKNMMLFLKELSIFKMELKLKSTLRLDTSSRFINHHRGFPMLCSGTRKKSWYLSLASLDWWKKNKLKGGNIFQLEPCLRNLWQQRFQLLILKHTMSCFKREVIQTILMSHVTDKSKQASETK